MSRNVMLAPSVPPVRWDLISPVPSRLINRSGLAVDVSLEYTVEADSVVLLAESGHVLVGNLIELYGLPIWSGRVGSSVPSSVRTTMSPFELSEKVTERLEDRLFIASRRWFSRSAESAPDALRDMICAERLPIWVNCEFTVETVLTILSCAVCRCAV